jgi:YegS/Rv2252/BmrU family lipid kinase
MQNRAIILINEKAGSDGKDEELRRDISDGFKKRMDVEIRFFKSENIIAEVERAIAEKPDVIIAGGGDGTINAVASKLLKTDIPLGILPLGTLNHFAKDAGIPLKISDAIENIVAGNIEKIDAAEVNETLFLNNSSIGLYPKIVVEREDIQLRGLSKWTAFAWAFLGVLKKYPMVGVRIETNGKSVEHKTPLLFVGNNEYSVQGLNIGGRERLTDGKMSLFLIRRTGRLGLLRLAFKALFGKIHQDKDFDTFIVSEIHIESDFPVLQVSTDGEVNDFKTPLHYRILPKALSVIVPSPSFNK